MDTSGYERPEGALIKAALKKAGRSVRSIAPEVGISDTRIRHVINGYQPVGRGQVIEIEAPAGTWAKIADAAGVAREEMRAVGRADVAALMTVAVGGPVQGDYVAAPGEPATVTLTESELEGIIRRAVEEARRLDRP